MSSRAALLLAGLLLAAGTQAAGTRAAGARAAEPDDRRLRIGVESLDYLPVGAVVDGAWVGAARDILDAFAADEGYVPEYVPLAVARLHATFLDGGVDFKFPDNPKWKAELKRGRAIAYSRCVIAFADGTMTLPERSGSGSIRVLGSVSGFTPWNWLADIESGKVQLRENADLTSLVRQAMLGRVDAVQASVAAVNWQLDRVLHAPGALVLDETLPHARDSYSLSSIRRPEVVAELDAWLQAHAARVEEIKARHQAEKGVPR